MKFSNILLGDNVEIDPSSTVNNVHIKDNVRIAKRCSIFGGPNNLLHIGENSYVGMNSILNGFAAPVHIGAHVSIAQNVNVMADSGPNASVAMQQLFPMQKAAIQIGNHCWIGASVVIMPGVSLGSYCVVAANSYVNRSFPAYSVVGGSPAKLLRTFTENEIIQLLEKND
jgi:acetyltransferase-like isoleucine patch superfamily enzyme